MSKYLTLDMKLVDEACVVEALLKMGFKREQIEVGDVVLREYWGGAYGGRERKARIRVDRRVFGGMDDFGFVQTPEGLQPIIGTHDEYHLRTLWQGRVQGSDFKVALRTAYSQSVVEAVAKKMRGTVTKRQEGRVQKVTVRFG